MKFKLLIPAFISAAVCSSNAAVFVVSNVVGGVAATDAVFQNAGAANASLLSGGIVHLGYFGTNTYVPSSSLSSIGTTIGDFISVATGIAGSASAGLEGSFAGFVEGVPFPSGAAITGSNALLGRSLYIFAGNEATLGNSTAWALKSVGVIQDDVPNELTYTANPKGGAAPVIGTIGSFTGNAGGQGSGTFSTLQLVAVPEPSTVLLGTIGVLGLLHRRRI